VLSLLGASYREVPLDSESSHSIIDFRASSPLHDGKGLDVDQEEGSFVEASRGGKGVIELQAIVRPSPYKAISDNNDNDNDEEDV
jgi:hypothetical protein